MPSSPAVATRAPSGEKTASRTCTPAGWRKRATRRRLGSAHTVAVEPAAATNRVPPASKSTAEN
jgi:hypothetical protein